MTARDDALRADLRALAEKWRDVISECKANDPRWILDRSVTTLGTALRELRAVLDAHEPATEPEALDAPEPDRSGPSRETVGMVCQTCGTDYGTPEPDAWRDETGEVWTNLRIHPSPAGIYDPDSHCTPLHLLSDDEIAQRVARAVAEARAEALRLVRLVESDMSEAALNAWRSADARRGLSDHDALLVHADALTRWSERLRMAFDGEDYRAEREVQP